MFCLQVENTGKLKNTDRWSYDPRIGINTEKRFKRKRPETFYFFKNGKRKKMRRNTWGNKPRYVIEWKGKTLLFFFKLSHSFNL